MKKQVKKLVLTKETVRNLSGKALSAANGGTDQTLLSAIVGTCVCPVSIYPCFPQETAPTQ
jgi:hypothetical protein